MPANDLKITQIKLDNKNRLWAVGQDISYFDGNSWNYLNYLNSALPSNEPYYLDTRSLSIDNDQNKWIGCANGPCISDVAVTKLSGQDFENSTSWTFTEFGLTGSYYQCPVIEASPYGSEVLAFFNDLNDGIGVTGTTGFIGATSGYLYLYNQKIEEWRNILGTGNLIPRVYKITPRGIDGKSYEYWVGTDNGIWIIKSSFYNEESLFSSDSGYFPNIKIINSENSGLTNDVVRDIKFDENGNAWIATANGLNYFDHENWSSWDSTIFTNLNSDVITNLVVRPNGHVFFSAGEGEVKQGTGLYHFNGTSLTDFNVSTGDLPNNNVISMEIIHNNTQNNNFRNYTNDLWVSCYNDVIQFSYQIPHVRATSDYGGATGWDFVNYQNSDNLNLPKTNKYSWDYPSWSGEDFQYLLRQHPGTDPSLIFTNTELKNIIDGDSGKYDFYTAGPIPSWDEISLAKGLTGSSFIVNATGGTCYSTSITLLGDNLVVGGYSDSPVINFGYKNNLDYLDLDNPNPTNLGSPVPSGSNQNVGFVAYYSKSGQPKGVIPVRGKSTKVLSVKGDPENSSLFVLGTFRGYIEVGEFIFNNVFPNSAAQSITGIVGPTGGPIGFSSMYYPGITGPQFNYPWILNGATGSTSGPFIPDSSLINNDSDALFLLEIDHNLGSNVSFGGIDFGVTGEFERSYKVKNFRYFPNISSDYDTSGITGAYGKFSEDSISMNISNDYIDLAMGISGGYSTLTNQWIFNNDIPGNSDFSFSSNYLGNYLSSGSIIQLDKDLNLYNTKTTSGTGDTYFNSIKTDEGSNTLLITGNSNNNFVFGSTGSTGYAGSGFSPFYLISDRSLNPSREGAQFLTPSFDIDSDQKLIYPLSKDGIYSLGIITSPTPSIGLNGSTFSVTGGTAFYVQSFSPNGLIRNEFSYPLGNSYGKFQDAILTDRDEYLLVINESGTTGGTGSNVVYKISNSGTLQGQKEISTDDSLTLGVNVTSDQDSNLFLEFSYKGSTGPIDFTYPSTTDFIPSIIRIDQYQPKTGVNFGNVSSRYGEGSWNWCDVHMNNRTFKVPLLSTVFMTNYPSDIYGKTENTWRLFDSRTNENILDVKGVPYFIYTFAKPGFYTIENSVEDANGNVYEVTRNSFIEVVDHTIKKDNDPDPFVVNSSDYGYIQGKNGVERYINDLSIDLLNQQMQILKQNSGKFIGSPLIIKDDPDATFRPLTD